MSQPPILLVEDEPSIQTVIRTYLEAAGYRLLITADGREALALAEAHEPLLVILDLNLPGMDGMEVAARLRERGIPLREEGELRLLCVPDRAIAEVARSIEPGPWVAHVSGSTPLAALYPHGRRFSVHPLQTLT